MGMVNNIGTWMLTRLVGGSVQARDEETAAGPLSPTAQLVGEEVYEDDMIDVRVPPASSSHFERYRKLIDSFDEDRESPLEPV